MSVTCIAPHSGSLTHVPPDPDAGNGDSHEGVRLRPGPHQSAQAEPRGRFPEHCLPAGKRHEASAQLLQKGTGKH